MIVRAQFPNSSNDQVCRWLPNNAWYLEPSNLELLDRDSNGAAGTALAANIAEERRRRAGLHSQAWLTNDLIFTRAIPTAGPAGVRWYAEELEQGHHHRALVRLLRQRAGP